MNLLRSLLALAMGAFYYVYWSNGLVDVYSGSATFGYTYLYTTSY